MIKFLFILSLLFQVNTPTPEPNTADGIMDQIDKISATAQALQDNLTFTTDGEQVYDADGKPLLPGYASPAMITTISHAKWMLDSSNTAAVFGPFAPIVNHIRIFFTLALTFFTVYFTIRLIKLALRFAKWLMRNWWRTLIAGIVARIIIVLAALELKFHFVANLIEWIATKIQSINFWN